MAKPFSKYLGKIALMAAVALFVACGDVSSGSGPENTESSAVEESSSSADIFSSSSSWIATNSSSSRNDEKDTFSVPSADTTKITYALSPFAGPLSNPHKGFTVPTGGAWTFVPEFEYGPYGSLNNRAWDLVSYGSGWLPAVEQAEPRKGRL